MKEEALHEFWKSVKRLEENVENRRFEYIANHMKGKKVLDVGGLDAKILKFFKKEIDYTSVDTLGEFNKRLRKSGVKAITMDVCEQPLPFPDNTFDTVIMGEVLEHLENPIFVLRNVKRVLKADGVLIGTTPNTYNIQSFVYSLVSNPSKRRSATCDSHIYAFRNEELYNLLKVAGFKSVEIKKICSRVPYMKINLPDKWVFKIFSPYYLFICKGSI